MAFKISSVDGLDSIGGSYAFFLPYKFYFTKSEFAEISIGGSYYTKDSLGYPDIFVFYIL